MIIRLPLPLLPCLLLGLAACSSNGPHDPDGAAAAPSAEAIAAPTRAELLLAEGDRLQELGRCRDALQSYGMAALEAGPTRGHALAAIHLCHWQLQRSRAGEDSFALWLQHELDQGRLPLRLLFQPGETRYLAEARISAPYGAWLRRIAQALQSSPQCLTLAGHAGPSAAEQRAVDLPLRRAQAVQRQLETLAPALKGRIRSRAAVPADEPLVGSASDDLRDALDRRVEFAIGPC